MKEYLSEFQRTARPPTSYFGRSTTSSLVGTTSSCMMIQQTPWFHRRLPSTSSRFSAVLAVDLSGSRVVAQRRSFRRRERTSPCVFDSATYLRSKAYACAILQSKPLLRSEKRKLGSSTQPFCVFLTILIMYKSAVLSPRSPESSLMCTESLAYVCVRMCYSCRQRDIGFDRRARRP
ncbi:hypothetical protein DFH11DRAFT_1614227 [Phellopilus nigrolimitatus]|nr:hypothetical protein DFH11DRAFT_1614227 [Phellopilus nigrolimitatus]